MRFACKKTLSRCLLAAFFLFCGSVLQAHAGLPWQNSPGTQDSGGTHNAAAKGEGGGFIESLFSGSSFSGFTNLDFTVLGVLAALGIYVFLRSRSMHQGQEKENDEQGQQRDDDIPGPGRDSEAYRKAQRTWDFLSSDPASAQKRQQQGEKPPSPPSEKTKHPAGSHSGMDLSADLGKSLPSTPSPQEAGFDTYELLQGAKVVYSRMHESIAESDWDDVEQFTTPEFFRQLQARVAAKRTAPHVLFVEAAVENAFKERGHDMADVVFASLLQFAADQAPQEVHEIWRFEKGPDTGDTWRISSMQRRK